MRLNVNTPAIVVIMKHRLVNMDYRRPIYDHPRLIEGMFLRIIDFFNTT